MTKLMYGTYTLTLSLQIDVLFQCIIEKPIILTLQIYFIKILNVSYITHATLTLNPLCLINKTLTLAVHDNTGAEDSSLPNSQHELQMDKRNIASVVREFFGTHKPR